MSLPNSASVRKILKCVVWETIYHMINSVLLFISLLFQFFRDEQFISCSEKIMITEALFLKLQLFHDIEKEYNDNKRLILRNICTALWRNVKKALPNTSQNKR